VIDATHATLTLSVQALAAIGVHSITATTGGEVASLANAFVVQPGTPLILSGGASAPQQSAVTFTILGQATQWVNGSTTGQLRAGRADHVDQRDQPDGDHRHWHRLLGSTGVPDTHGHKRFRRADDA
jgi:hypothetical protein